MKLVYVLISDEADFYYEQTLVSVYSARSSNPEIRIELLVDKKTAEYIKSRGDRLNSIVDEIKIIDVPDNFSKKVSSRYIKTNLRKYVSGDFLYIDCDTIVQRPLKEIERLCSCDIGAIRHCHLIDTLPLSLTDYLKSTKKEYWGSSIYYNGGVIYVKDTENARIFFEEWHKLWFSELQRYNETLDQFSFSQIENKFPSYVCELDGTYNCQIETEKGKHFMHNPCIIHYYSKTSQNSCFPLKNRGFLNQIRSEGITEEVKDMINKPQKFYCKPHSILDKIFIRLYKFMASKLSMLINQAVDH